MTKNYNATLGIPYVKTFNINFDYSCYDNREVALSVTETMGIKDSQGKYLDISGLYSDSFSEFITTNEMDNTTFPLINVDTGEETEQTMTIREMNQVLISFVRKYQKERDNPVVTN
jgi:hypothetical protein